MDIYLVKWYDAFSCDKWTSNEDLSGDSEFPLIIKSVGYFFKKTKKYIVLTQNSGNNDQFSGTISIPRKCILKIKKL